VLSILLFLLEIKANTPYMDNKAWVQNFPGSPQIELFVCALNHVLPSIKPLPHLCACGGEISPTQWKSDYKKKEATAPVASEKWRRDCACSELRQATCVDAGGDIYKHRVHCWEKTKLQ
jgi:hypothetical protein